MGVEPSVLDVAPTLDTFVPFEFPIAELPPGWYRLECDVAIDGVAQTVHPGDPFSIPWPRAAVRKGTARIGRSAGDVKLVDVTCAGDSTRVSYEAAHEPDVKLSVDGSSLPVLAVEFDDGSGSGAVVGFPALRSHETLRIQVRGAEPVEVALP
jgi:hypothetical protein